MSDDNAEIPHKSNSGSSERPAPAGPEASGTGTIKIYQAEKGFGFILRQGEPDVFFHVTDLVDRDVAVEIGQKVRFDLEPSNRKPGSFVAVRVRRSGEFEVGSGKGSGDGG